MDDRWTPGIDATVEDLVGFTFMHHIGSAEIGAAMPVEMTEKAGKRRKPGQLNPVDARPASEKASGEHEARELGEPVAGSAALARGDSCC